MSFDFTSLSAASTPPPKRPSPAQIQAWNDWKIRKTFSSAFGALHDLRYTQSALIPTDFHSTIDDFMRQLQTVSRSASRMVRNIYLCPSCRKLVTGRKTRSDHKHKRYASCPSCSTKTTLFYTRIPTYRDSWLTDFHTNHPELLL